jgi:hypothetical protein
VELQCGVSEDEIECLVRYVVMREGIIRLLILVENLLIKWRVVRVWI